MSATAPNQPHEPAVHAADVQLKSTIRVGHLYAICLLVLAMASGLLVLWNPALRIGSLTQTFLAVGLVGSFSFTSIRLLRTRILQLEDEIRSLRQELRTTRPGIEDRTS